MLIKVFDIQWLTDILKGVSVFNNKVTVYAL